MSKIKLTNYIDSDNSLSITPPHKGARLQPLKTLCEA